MAESLPALDIRRAPDQKVVLSWPEQAMDTVLEQSAGLAAENTWQPVSESPALANGTYALALEASAPRQYYRLQDTNTAAITEVRIVPVPDGALVPDVMVDKAGVAHMVYGLNNNAYYERSTHNGASFSPPVKVNSTGTVVTTMGERGPKLAVGADGVIHVVWADQWKPGVEVYVRYARSLDGGKSFGPRQTVSSMPGVDGTTMTVDRAGNVLVFWHVMVSPPPAVPQATWVHMARSTNNGASFAANEKVQTTNLAGIACSMCLMRARCDADGEVCLAFRNAEGNVRDFYLLKGAPTKNDFRALRINQDNWIIDYCPMCGPELTLDPNGRAICAFMSRNKAYWAISDNPVTGFNLHVATPANEPNEIYPSAYANRRGEVLFVWQVGPMSTSGTAQVKWALYRNDGTFTGQQATVGTSFSGTKATAFVGTDDNFYLVTSAKP